MSALAGLFSKKKPPLIGIDISSPAVKVLELSRNGEHLRVERYAVEPLPQNAVVEHAITEVEQVAQVVERAIKKSGTKVRHAAAAHRRGTCSRCRCWRRRDAGRASTRRKTSPR